MNARKRKATRQTAYRAGPLAPWRSINYMENLRRFQIKRAGKRPILFGVDLAQPGGDIGCEVFGHMDGGLLVVENIRFISSPEL